MKSKIFFLVIVMACLFIANPVLAKEEVRDVSPFSKISLRVSGKVYLEQGNSQSVRIEADSETLEQIITEVKDRSLIIRFPNTNMFKRWSPGKIEIYITVPDIDELNISGSGDITSLISDRVATRVGSGVSTGAGSGP